jgi:hypothetical protein
MCLNTLHKVTLSQWLLVALGNIFKWCPESFNFSGRIYKAF